MVQIKKTEATDKHGYDVNSVIFYNESIYSGGDDGKIMLWSVNLEKRAEIEAHPCSVYCIVGLNNSIYSCSNDGTVKKWTLDLKPVTTIMDEDGLEFWKMAVWENNLYIGDDQGVIRVFVNDSNKGNYLILEAVKDMTAENNVVYSSNSTGVVVTEINPNKKNSSTCKQIIPGRAPICLISDKLIITDGPAKGLTLVNVKVDYNPFDNFENAHEMIILALSGVKGNDGQIYLFSGGWDKIVKKWKITNNKFELISNTSTDIVINCIFSFNENTIYAAGGEGHILKINY